ncbi:hypothetical protein V1504DRAFT_464073 [Lipomyces starkeyi]
MLANTILRIVLLTSLAQAFVIPLGTGEGLYRAYVNERGDEIHERISSVPNLKHSAAPAPTTSNIPATLQARQQSATMFCGCGFTLTPSNCDAAVSNIEAQLSQANGIIPADSTFYYIFGDVVAFACNRGVTIGIADGTYADMLVQITNACGWYMAGTYQTIDGYGMDILYGYMRYWDGLDFCANADSSPAHSC